MTCGYIAAPLVLPGVPAGDKRKFRNKKTAFNFLKAVVMSQ